MKGRDRRWSWYGQALDIAFAVAGLVVIFSMVYRNEYSLNAILLVAFCGGGITAGQLIELLVGRWTSKSSSETS